MYLHIYLHAYRYVYRYIDISRAAGARLLFYTAQPHNTPDKCQVCSDPGELNADLSNIPC